MYNTGYFFFALACTLTVLLIQNLFQARYPYSMISYQAADKQLTKEFTDIVSQIYAKQQSIQMGIKALYAIIIILWPSMTIFVPTKHNKTQQMQIPKTSALLPNGFFNDFKIRQFTTKMK